MIGFIGKVCGRYYGQGVWQILKFLTAVQSYYVDSGAYVKVTVKVVFFDRQLLNGESTTTNVWGQLSTTCSNVTQVAQWAVPSCSRPQLTTENGVRNVRSN